MRIALISDIHSNYHALEAVLGDIAGRVGMNGWELFAHTARTGSYPG